VQIARYAREGHGFVCHEGDAKRNVKEKVQTGYSEANEST
jgi:hypothetical protein